MINFVSQYHCGRHRFYGVMYILTNLLILLFNKLFQDIEDSISSNSRYEALRKLLDEVFKRKIETIVKIDAVKRKKEKAEIFKTQGILRQAYIHNFTLDIKEEATHGILFSNLQFLDECLQTKSRFVNFFTIFMHSDLVYISKYLFSIFDVL